MENTSQNTCIYIKIVIQLDKIWVLGNFLKLVVAFYICNNNNARYINNLMH